MRFKTGGKATGFACPQCKFKGPHNIQRWIYNPAGELVGIVLSCHSCECVFELELN
jgi:hypothetical protein